MATAMLWGAAWSTYVMSYGMLADEWVVPGAEEPRISTLFVVLNVCVVGPGLAFPFLAFVAPPTQNVDWAEEACAAVLALAIYDVLFWALHRLCHANAFLFRHVHYWHHKWKHTTHASSALDAHPLEMIFVNVLPFLFALWATGVTQLTCAALLVVGSATTQWTHSDLRSYHELHHSRGDCNFGTMIWMDTLAGTKRTQSEKRE